ncbi:hypothetical protein JCM11491_004694 [Sporobolomyces phaffii]
MLPPTGTLYDSLEQGKLDVFKRCRDDGYSMGTTTSKPGTFVQLYCSIRTPSGPHMKCSARVWIALDDDDTQCPQRFRVTQSDNEHSCSKHARRERRDQAQEMMGRLIARVERLIRSGERQRLSSLSDDDEDAEEEVELRAPKRRHKGITTESASTDLPVAYRASRNYGGPTCLNPLPPKRRHEDTTTESASTDLPVAYRARRNYGGPTCLNPLPPARRKPLASSFRSELACLIRGTIPSHPDVYGLALLLDVDHGIRSLDVLNALLHLRPATISKMDDELVRHEATRQVLGEFRLSSLARSASREI